MDIGGVVRFIWRNTTHLMRYNLAWQNTLRLGENKKKLKKKKTKKRQDVDREQTRKKAVEHK